MVRLNEYLDMNRIISDEQFGFRAAHSTQDQLLLTYDEVSISIDKGQIVDLIFFDFAKAFDKVCHRILLFKLLGLGISGEILRWICGFLSNRVMKVRVAGACSYTVPVTSGVPQGSVLGPVLFIIFINHVVSSLRCKFKIFADDIKLYLGFERGNIADGVHQCQDDIDKLVRTSESWGLLLNVEKCAVLRFAPRNSIIQTSGVSPFCVNNEYINFSESHSDLGVTVDRTLRFHFHISKNVAIAGGITSNLLSSTLCRSAEFLINIYTTQVRPKMEYSACLWNTGYVGDLRLLERIQRRWTRAVFELRDLSYADRLQHLKLYSFQGRLLRGDLLMVWKILNGMCAINFDVLFNLAPATGTRGHPYKLAHAHVNVDARRRFFSQRVIKKWNSLSVATVMSETLGEFKRRLEDDLGEELYEYC